MKANCLYQAQDQESRLDTTEVGGLSLRMEPRLHYQGQERQGHGAAGRRERIFVLLTQVSHRGAAAALTVTGNAAAGSCLAGAPLG